MKLIRRFVILLVTVLSLAASVAPAWSQEWAQIRFVHVDPGSPALDLFINGELAATDMTYGASTAYIRLQAGKINLTANLATTSVQLIDETLPLKAEAAVVILSSRADGRFYAVADDLSELAFGQARFSLFNALEEEATIAIGAAKADDILQAELAAGAGAGPHEVEAGTYKLSLGSTSFGTIDSNPRFDAALRSGTSHLLIIHGSRNDPQLLSVSSATDGGGDSGSIRFVHAVAGAAPLDVRINDQLILPALAFAEPTRHIALPSGSHSAALFLGPAEIMAEQLDIRAGQMSTVVIMGSSAGLSMRRFIDSVDKVDEASAVVSLINAIPGSVISHLKMEGGAIAALNVPFGEAGDAAQIVPGTQSMTVHLDIGDDRGMVEASARHFASGSYYNLIALPGGAFSAPRLLIAETSVQRSLRARPPITAAAEAAETVADSQVEPQSEAPDSPEAAASAEESAPEPETSPIEAEAAPQPEAASGGEQAGEIPVSEASGQSESLPAADDKPVATEDLSADAAATEAANLLLEANATSGVTPYAIVAVDPNSALHVRQFPSSDAMSLGLLPPDSSTLVLGRRAPVDPDSGDLSSLPEYLRDYTTDPAADLLPFQDLPAADTWLFVVYLTPDGGTLFGWINAFYLRVFDQNGERQRLASLAPVGQDQVGGSSNTAVQPPSLADHISARVYGLNPDAYLNLRVGNSAASEVLTQVPPDAILGFFGLDVAEKWAFVEYKSPQGNVVTGWASVEYLQLLLNGRPAIAASLRALDPSAVRVIGDGATGAIQSADPSDSDRIDESLSGIVGEVNVNFDSALHLRRYPDATAESLALIPRGIVLLLEGVTESSGWYRVQYQGDVGWVAGEYLILSMDGRVYARAFLDGQLPRFNNQGF